MHRALPETRPPPPGPQTASRAADRRGFDPDPMIKYLLGLRTGSPHDAPAGRGAGWPDAVDVAAITALCHAAREVFLAQPMLLAVTAPVTICGDIHGQFYDLLRIFELADTALPYTSYLFLGDYVDRGTRSLETICLLLALKVKYPTAMWLLRGNHEAASINSVYGFFDECKRRANVKLWKTFISVFDCMPVAAVVAGCMFCCHGGLSPELTTRESLEAINAIARPCDVPDDGLMCDLLWADPDDVPGWSPNDRGVSYTFGRDVLAAFLERSGLELVVRAHQVVEDGYEFFGSQRLVTVFSAPNYCGDTHNVGCVMRVRSDLTCSFQGLREQVAARG